MSEKIQCSTCSRRIWGEDATLGEIHEGPAPISTVGDIAAMCKSIKTKKREYFIAFLLDARHKLISREVISIGTLTASLAHPREIFNPAVRKSAAAIILAHNHPSGDPSPSEEDCRLTKRIAECARFMGIELLDHVIVGSQGCYSFKTSGAL